MVQSQQVSSHERFANDVIEIHDLNKAILKFSFKFFFKHFFGGKKQTNVTCL